MGENSYEVNGHYNSYSITSNYGLNHPNGQWHSWTVRTASSGTQFFLDGQLILDTNHFISNTAVLGSDLIIGSMISESGIGIKIDGNNEQWNGRLDDIAIWNRALSDQEVQQLYSGSSSYTYNWSSGGETTPSITPTNEYHHLHC